MTMDERGRDVKGEMNCGTGSQMSRSQLSLVSQHVRLLISVSDVSVSRVRTMVDVKPTSSEVL